MPATSQPASTCLADLASKERRSLTRSSRMRKVRKMLGTSRTSTTISVAVIVGIIAIVAVFGIIRVFWIRMARFFHKPPPDHHHMKTANNELDSTVMSYFRPYEVSLLLPKPLPPAYDPSRRTIAASGSRQLVSRNEAGRSSVQEIHVSYQRRVCQERDSVETSSPSSLCAICENCLRGPLIHHCKSTLGPAFPAEVVRYEMDGRNFGRALFHGRAQTIARPSGEVVLTRERLSDFTCGTFESSPTSTSCLPSPPPTPSPMHIATPVLSGHDLELHPAFIYSPPPHMPNGSIPQFIWSPPNSTISNAAQDIGEEHIVWSDILPLEDYGSEDQLIRAQSSSASIRDQLLTPPPTPNVFFTPSPPDISPLSDPAAVDEERLPVWTSAAKFSQITTDHWVTKSENIIDDDRSVDLYGQVAAHQVEVTPCPRPPMVTIHPKVETVPKVNNDSPPAYQNLQFDYETRLARKRASSPFADTPAPDKSTTRIFLHQVAATVKPRPPLEELRPLLCRKVDASKLYTRRAFSELANHPVDFKVPSTQQERRAFGRQPTICTSTAEMLETRGGWNEEHIHGETVMGIAV